MKFESSEEVQVCVVDQPCKCLLVEARKPLFSLGENRSWVVPSVGSKAVRFSVHLEHLLEGSYKVGKRNGVWTAWWKNGKVKWMYSYSMGTLDGKCSDWYENGQKASEREFLAGHLATASVWLPNGEVCPRSKVEDGAGRFFIHGQKGMPTRALTYRNGKKVDSHLINTIPIIR